MITHSAPSPAPSLAADLGPPRAGRAGLLVGLAAALLCGPLAGISGAAPPLAARLRAVADGKLEPGPVTITYDDLHGLHGGLTLTLHGNGRVEQKAVRFKAGKPRTVTAAELRELVQLIVQHQAWEQRVPPRNPVPDESRAELTLVYGGDRAVMWEWYNDLAKNRRLVEIRERMKKLAWK